MENVAERDSTSDASNDPTKTALEAPNSLSLPTKMRFANGTTLGHYEVLEPLGQGGMGEVKRLSHNSATVQIPTFDPAQEKRC